VTIFFTVLHVVVCLVLIVVVLLQRGKGAEAGAMIGGGGAGTMFGSRGAGNFLTRLTSGAAVVFMLTSLTLAYFGQEDSGSTLFDADEPTTTESPFGEPESDPAATSEGSVFEDVTPSESGAEGASAFEEVPAAAPSEAPAAETGSDAGLAPPEPETPEPGAATP
jgi:preprotein translocase subunit SecG